MYGSWDPPGARLLDAVTVIDRLASPGGDPWKLAQTHRSLARFLLEEAYEAYDAIEADDQDALREELGDVLLQVLLHARLAEDLPDGRAWTVDDVAGDLVDKLIRRNPHVFGGEPLADLDEITDQWERIKKAEKARALGAGRYRLVPAGPGAGREDPFPGPARWACPCPLPGRPATSSGTGCCGWWPRPATRMPRRRCGAQPAGTPTRCGRPSAARDSAPPSAYWSPLIAARSGDRHLRPVGVCV